VRRFLTLRWFRYHLMMILLVVAFLALGWWQWTRGEGGNARSYGYALEWPAFAIFVVVFWIRLMRDELKPPRSDGAAAETSGGGAVGEPAEPEFPDVVRPEIDPETDPELAAYNDYLARLNAGAKQK
jgi:DNA-binding transcriptional regulator of glucitol operon